MSIQDFISNYFELRNLSPRGYLGGGSKQHKAARNFYAYKLVDDQIFTTKQLVRIGLFDKSVNEKMIKHQLSNWKHRRTPSEEEYQERYNLMLEFCKKAIALSEVVDTWLSNNNASVVFRQVKPEDVPPYELHVQSSSMVFYLDYDNGKSHFMADKGGVCRYPEYPKNKSVK